jgi:hypothetical protein
MISGVELIQTASARLRGRIAGGLRGAKERTALPKRRLLWGQASRLAGQGRRGDNQARKLAPLDRRQIDPDSVAESLKL